jgi:hypothetical protein
LRSGRIAIGSTKHVTAVPMHVGQVPQQVVGVAANQGERNGSSEMSLSRSTTGRLLPRAPPSIRGSELFRCGFSDCRHGLRVRGNLCVDGFTERDDSSGEARSQAAKQRDAQEVNACDAPYSKQLFQGLIVDSNQKAMRQREKVYNLWANGSLMQTYQADVAPIASQLKRLASMSKAQSLTNPAMNEFAHAVAAELDDSLDLRPSRYLRLHSGPRRPPLLLRLGTEVGPRGGGESLVESDLKGRRSDRGRLALRRCAHARPRRRAWTEPFTIAQRSALGNLPGELG